ncbi:MAG: hypothetical protein JNM00_12855, partial [Flavobacteriales bacterium]|nr:hypothetical protein [Flavobacteriales bacterium]
MMKTLYGSVLLIILLIFSNLSTKSQVLDVVVEVDHVHYDSYTDFGPLEIDLNGFVTYSVWALTDATTNRVWGIAGGACPEEVSPDCVLDGVCDCRVEFDGQLFQHEFIGCYLTQPLYPFTLSPLFPSAQFDSYFTFSTDDVAHPGSVFVLMEACVPTRCEAFEGPVNTDYFDGGNFYIDNGSIFTTTSEPSTLAGSDQRVKIAQFTTDSSWCMEFQVAWFETNNPLIDADNETGVYQVPWTCIQNPCVEFPMDTDIEAYVPLCFGGDAGIIVEDGGNGAVDYQLHSCTDDAILTSQNDALTGWNISSLAEGDYYITMIDSLGCRDTSICVNITIPDELIFGASITQDIPCFGDLGELATTCTGGTGVVMVDYNGPGSNDGDVICGDAIVDLPTGTYVLTATDENNCAADTTITFANPAALQINITLTQISCLESDNGALTGTITGGTGVIDAEWSGPVSNTFSGPSPLTITINGLDEGDYTISATDANGCPVDSTFTLIEPEGLTVEAIPTNASCPGVCDGSVE